MLTMTMKRLQMNLKFLGYYGGEIDGIKGKLTEQAIRNYQRDNGLTVDGIAGQKAIDSIRAKICDIQRKIGATVDGVAGSETITKNEEYNRKNATQNTTANDWTGIEHFKISEFACKDGCGYDNIDTRLVRLLEKIRAHFGGKPLIITSGCRCAKHNAEVGGVQGSRHVLGKAADFYIKGVSTQDLLNYCKELVANGEARYTYTNSKNMNGVVHIDIA